MTGPGRVDVFARTVGPSVGRGLLGASWEHVVSLEVRGADPVADVLAALVAAPPTRSALVDQAEVVWVRAGAVPWTRVGDLYVLRVGPGVVYVRTSEGVVPSEVDPRRLPPPRDLASGGR